MFAASKTASVSGGYQISRSLRFNSADSAYLSRTPATASNQKTWTWSGWVKLTKNTSQQYIFGGTQDNYNVLWTLCSFYQDKIYLQSYSGGFQFNFQTTQVFRDYSAWYHIVVAVDTTQATDTNRVKLYVNGNLVTSYVTASYPTQNVDTLINGNWLQTISGNIATSYLDAYQTEINFIDGQALTPSSFGQTDAQTGVWQPKAYSGSYGTNGFYLNFSDNSNTTAATLGKDYSGNGNNWTPNNFSVAAGAGNDSLVDSPTSYGTDTGVGGTVRGNYATLSPLYGGATGITNGNLDVTLSGGTQYGSMSMTTGKWYWEVTPTASLSGSYLGVMDSTFIKTDATWGTTTTSTYVNNGNQYGIGGTGAYGATYTTGDVIGFALDLDNGTLVFYKNGTSQGTASTGMTGREWRPMLYAIGGTYACNFGQRPFAYTAPSGFKALCTQNLPTPTIGATTATQAGKYFNPVLYTGNGSTQSITGVGFQPDFTWIKVRSTTYDHQLVDAVRGSGKVIHSNLTNAEATLNTVTSFNSDGFTVNGTTYAGTNGNGSTFVAWNWKANGSGSTNTSGSITSTVSANTTSGFSVVTYTGNGTANATFGHGLGVQPSFVIIKSRSSGTQEWRVWAKAYNGGNGYGILNLTSAFTVDDGTLWGSYPTYTGPTSSVVTVSSFAGVNGSGATFVAYCFAEIAGYSKFGSFVGNGSSDGPFLYLGFTPKYILIKKSSASGTDWRIITINTSYLSANTSAAEYDSPPGPIRGMSNGVKIVGTGGDINENGSTFIYAAFASYPFKYALAQSA